MENLYRRLPPTNALVAFEAAARLGNFTRAGDELLISQAAVSRHVQRLEERLGVQLFVREHRRVRLTAAGRVLYDSVHESLEQIASTALRLKGLDEEGTVAIGANNAIAFYWLRPRLMRFQQRYSDTEMHLVASDADPDFERDALDFAVRYGDGGWPELEVDHLFDEELFPVCSPGFLRGDWTPRPPEWLMQTGLLHMQPQGPGWVTWEDFLRSAGVVAMAPLPGRMTFNTYPVLLQAALDGQGVAIGTRYLLDPLLASGRLVRPVAHSMRTGRAYYLTRRRDVPLTSSAAAFRQWLLGE
jgi:DNA-binding transcriptional LysR family regulator